MQSMIASLIFRSACAASSGIRSNLGIVVTVEPLNRALSKPAGKASRRSFRAS